MQHHASADPAYPLYDARWEHDACGTGFIVQISGERSHALVEMALEALARLTHRGAQDADAETGDGAGVLTQLPTELFRAELAAQGITPPEAHALAVGMLFLPPRTRSPEELETSRQIIEQTLAELEIPLLLWRQPPLDESVLGSQARATLPTISQVLLACPDKLTPEAFDASLYNARRLIERRWLEAGLANAYVASLSRHTLVYKGLMAPDTLARFYLDLANPLYTSAFAIFHQRYSTNTFPSWPLAQPFRMLAHNGEINTLLGNRNWMRAREKALTAARWGEKLADLLPVIQEGGSDSAQLDNVLEFLTCSGRDLLHSMQMLVPPAWEQMPELDTAWRAWCEYHAGQMEPWDGPAALVFSDGRFVGAALDRNGLRPARYTLTSNGLLILASEVGVISCEPHEVVEKGRLGPGQMIAVDLERHAVLRDEDIKALLAQRQPYEQWLDANLVRLTRLPQVVASELCSNGGNQQEPDAEALFLRQLLFGVTNEDVELILRAMVQNAKEPIWSMGDDTPLASLSLRSRSLADYFHQRFAQVTNPPIDPLREQVVMSLDCYLGRRESLLSESPRHAHLIHLETPLLTEAQLETLRHLEEQGFRARTLEATFALAEGPTGLEVALARLEREAVAAVQEGIDLLILSDLGTDLEHAPVPMLLAVGAVHQELIRRGLRTSVSLICETGAAWDIHQIALLLGYGAEAIMPAVALATVRALAGERHLESVTPEEAVERYFHGVEEGLRKVMARMGISTVRNIIGGGQFEIVALEPALVERCFAGSPAHPGRIGLEQIGRQLIEHHQKLAQPAEQPVMASRAAAGAGAAHQRRKLPEAGYYRYRRDAEYHAFNPLVVRALQKVAQSGDPEDYRRFTELIYGRPPTNIRDLLSFVPRQPIPIEEVEPVEAIRTRFVVSAMSLGALSPEAHRTIAAAMNSIGGRNNTGEGGEDPDWYYELLEGHPVSSKIKQVASARFGVTTEYLVRAEELEIKMAQGSKPGEGGQLPPNKVTPFIARLRHTAPGVPLISPPPHHDIYSIEDLAQLIYDLRQVNPRARIGVKLVSSKGVGTIAAGVAKAHANYIHIAGHDGGTGASPFQSIKHAGIPWELGLAETQQTLVRNGLRNRVRVRVDGGLKTGRDVVIAAMLGADEFGFGTAIMVSLGCDMARQCHLNTCPAGIATQREDLRAKYTGRPEMVVNYLTLLAQEVREILAQLGVRRLDEIIGRADLLQCPEEVRIELAPVLATPTGSFVAPAPPPPGSQVAAQILSEAEQALNGERSVFTQHSIQNADRTVGASLAGEIARRYGNQGLPGVSVTCTFHGSAGQSFGAFCVPGMRLILNGEANDYVGKGMTGGQIVIMPPPAARYPAHKNIIMGNAVLYGATGGQLFAAGCAGERFAVRNSGALAVVEGVGAHACEYMTGGMVVVLGSTGINFGAGMSAGVAYVLDTEGVFPPRCNTELVELQRISDPDEAEALRKLIVLHRKKTHSWRAAQILAEWDHMQRFFWRVAPRERVQTARDFLGAYPEEKRDAVGS